MNTGNVAFVFCVFMLTYQGVRGHNEDNRSEESAELGGEGKNHTDASAEGPPDSHEAMNNRELQLKPKLTTSERKKRSYQFLMGLVKRNNSNYEVTNQENKFQETAANEAQASELLLELMVKIAQNPDQWSKVHNLLQKIDKDLLKSKQIVENIKTYRAEQTKAPDKEKEPNQSGVEAVKWIRENITDDTQKLDLNHDRNKTIRGEDVKLGAKSEYETTKYPWPLSTRPSKNAYQKNFAYHRVTGNPLIHSTFNKNPKAYIAVSVIAPKPLLQPGDEEEVMLENELKGLKPWTHQQNLKNMASLRSRWVIQSDEKYAP